MFRLIQTFSFEPAKLLLFSDIRKKNGIFLAFFTTFLHFLHFFLKKEGEKEGKNGINTSLRDRHHGRHLDRDRRYRLNRWTASRLCRQTRSGQAATYR